MSNKQLINLIDDLALTALKCELAKQNFEKTREELEELASKFNNEIENMNS